MPLSTAKTVLVATGDIEQARQLMAFLEEIGCDAEWADTAEKAFNRLDDRLFNILIADLTVSRRRDGRRLMKIARDRNPDVCVILLVDKSEVGAATEAMLEGAYDFQTAPLNLGKLQAVLERGLANQRLVMEQVELKRQLDEQYGLRNIVGKSRQMAQVYNSIRQIAPGTASVLITGEPGTGKDLIAHAIHTNSPRRDEMFVKLNCGQLSETMLECELFGYTRGAFTGAAQPRAGRLELADQGSLFLDNIDRMPLSLQERLLPVLEKREFRRQGDSRPIRTDIRLLAASNRSLEVLVDEGAFHQELSVFLKETVINVPPLRLRREDIPLLVEHFLKVTSEEKGRPTPSVTRHAMDLLLRYDWPGNIRELRNIVEGMILTARQGQPLDVKDIPEHIRQTTAPEVGEMRIPTGTPMATVERIVIEETMKVCGFDKERCARMLGIGLRTLYRKLKAYES